jgi:hypothetical protein
MTSHEDQIRALLNEAARMPSSLGKYEVLEEAVRLADLHNDIEMGVEARLPLMAVAGNLLRGDAMAVAFTWCLHQYDARPDLFAGRNLFWEYRTLIGRLANFDTVSRAQLENMLDDYTARLIREGRGPAMALSAKLLLGPDVGDPAMSVSAMEDIQRLRLSSVLTAADRFQHAVFIGDDGAALRVVEAELIAPTRAGRNAPFDMHWYDLFTLLWRQGRGSEVPKWLGRAERQLNVRDCYYWPFGKVVTALTLVGRLDDAVKVAGQCQRAVREYTDPLTLLHFCLDMGVLFDRLHAVGREAVLVRFADGPHAPPGVRPNGKYGVTEVRDWLHAQSRELAERFDRRNGNDYFAGLIRDRADLQQFAQPPG